MSPDPLKRTKGPTRPALSLVEVVISIAITGTLLASVFGVVGVSAKRSIHTAEASRAAWLARDLTAEIASRPCVFNTNGTGQITGETQMVSLGDIGALSRDSDDTRQARTTFNDVYDYEGWTSTPPVDLRGVPLPGFEGWTRSVDIDAVTPGSFEARVFNPECMLIRVEVSVRGRVVHSEHLLRSAATDTLRITPADSTPSPINNGGGNDSDDKKK